MRLDSSLEQLDETLDGFRHGLPIPLPQRGAALDVGEEESDGPRWEIGHDPLQSLGLTWCCPIVARGETDLGWQAALVAPLLVRVSHLRATPSGSPAPAASEKASGPGR